MPLYQSAETASTAHWGRATWTFLFRLAAAFPHAKECERDVPLSAREVAFLRARFRSLLLALADLVPCPVCQRHFVAYLRRHSLDRALEDRESLLSFLHAAKQAVNHRLGKRGISRATARRRHVPPCAEQIKSGRTSKQR